MGPTTRRALIAGAASLPAATAIASVAGAKAETPAQTRRRDRREFIERIAFWSPQGRLVATRAMAMGLDPADCIGVQLYDGRSDERMPMLMFQKRGAPHVTIHIRPNEAWESGPVAGSWGQWLADAEARV